jgi:hypothetical protein
MSKMIQIRNVPDEIHYRLKAMALENRMTLSDFLLQQVEDIARRPPINELKAKLSAQPSIYSSVSPVAMVREERDR